MTHRERYYNAHLEWFKKRYPATFKDGNYSLPPMPQIMKANGLTRYIVNILFWLPYTNGTRVSSAGRLIDGVEKQPSGVMLSTKKWIPGSTRKGTADITATIFGRSVKIEIKIGSDRPSQYQLEEQKREQDAQGCYEFISTPDQFWILYDLVIKS